MNRGTEGTGEARHSLYAGVGGDIPRVVSTLGPQKLLKTTIFLYCTGYQTGYYMIKGSAIVTGNCHHALLLSYRKTTSGQARQDLRVC